jgi:E3 ubiquitin-protein ligase synoviolin
MASETTWHEKGAYVMLLELLKEALSFVVYVVFFLLVFVYYGMPLHIIRDVYMSYMSFQRKLGSYLRFATTALHSSKAILNYLALRYRQLTANLSERFPDATAQEIANAGNTCIICR